MLSFYSKLDKNQIYLIKDNIKKICRVRFGQII